MNKKRLSGTLQYWVSGSCAILFLVLAATLQPEFSLDSSTLGLGVRINLTWLVWIFLILACIVILPFFGPSLTYLSKKSDWIERLHKFFQNMRGSGVGETSRMMSHPMALPVLLAIAAIAIGLTTMALHRLSPTDDDRFSSGLYGTVAGMLGYDTRVEGFTDVVRAQFLTPFTDKSSYLNDCVTIADALKESGAHLVLFPVPEVVTEREYEKLEELRNSGIAVLGIRHATTPNSGGGAWRAVPADGIYAMEHLTPGIESLLQRFVLGGAPWSAIPRPSRSILPILIQKRLGQMDSVTIAHVGDRLLIGDKVLPLGRTGVIYSRDRFAPPDIPEIRIFRGYPWYEGVIFRMTPRVDMLEVNIAADPIAAVDAELIWQVSSDRSFLQSNAPTNRLVKTMSSEIGAYNPLSLARLVKGKMVILTTNMGSETGLLLPERAYASVIQNVLNGTLTRKSEHGHLLFTALGLILAVILSLYARPMLASVITLLLAFATPAMGALFYFGFDLLIDILYPLLALGIASFTFPLLKFAVQSRDRVM